MNTTNDIDPYIAHFDEAGTEWFYVINPSPGHQKQYNILVCITAAGTTELG